MQFNSYFFLLIFLPLAVGSYYFVSLTRFYKLRLPLIIGLTILFYAKGARTYLPLLVASVALNYLCAWWILKVQDRKRLILLTVGVSLNVGTLLYFKYTNFIIQNIDLLTGQGFDLQKIALPLGISFYTFQQIAFLVDTARGQVSLARPLSYAASILYFPYIISGPITFYREVGPQLDVLPQRSKIMSDILVGSTIFVLGLFKKTVIADSCSLWVDPVFSTASTSQAIPSGVAWSAAATYILQIYFDFSGYSDMAIGLSRMFGIRLPANFHSPIRVTSIIDFWRRWHITLGRFVNTYIFQPICIPLSRWAAMKGLGRGGMLILGTLAPTFLSMFIIGSWHGGSWTFVLFGVLHGVYVVTNEAFRFMTRKARKGKATKFWHLAAGNILTMLAAIFAFVPFRSPDLTTTLNLWSAMFWFNNASATWTLWPSFQSLGLYAPLCVLIPGFLMAYLLPNTQQFMSKFEPVLEWPKWRELSLPLVKMTWLPTLGWALVLGAVLFMAFAFVGRGSSNFVYFGF